MASEALIRRQQAGGEIRDVLRERERERDEFLFAFCVLTGGGMRG